MHLIINNGEKLIYTSLFIGNEDIVIDAKVGDFPYDVRTKGSKYDKLRYDFVQLEKDLNTQRKEFINEMFSLREQGKWNDSLQKAYWSASEPLGKIKIIDNKLDEIRDGFIEKNINSYYALYLLGIYKAEYSESKILNLIEKLTPELRKTAYAKSIYIHLKNPDLKVGDNYYDFTALKEDGENVKFSEYFKGKYVLLDFSTIYCGWCLKAIPELEKIKHSQSGKLEVITFYMDKNQAGFKNLIQKHSENWNVLWDKEGRLSDTYAKYKVFATPTFYLFGPNGELVRRFDGFSEELFDQIGKEINK